MCAMGMQPNGEAPGSRYRLLLAGVGVPLLLLVAVVGVAQLGRHDVSGRRTTPAPTDTAAPTEQVARTPFPSLIEADDFTLHNPQAYGHIDVPPAVPQPEITVAVTVDTPPTRDWPTAMPVWQLVSRYVDPRDVAQRFGFPGPPDELSADGASAAWNQGLSVDGARFSVGWEAAPGVSSPRLAAIPRSSADAARVADQWLNAAGLAPPPGTPATVHQTSRGLGAAYAEWVVTWPRLAPGQPAVPIDDTQARVSNNGTLRALDLHHQQIDGGATYPLRPWQDAVADARAGRWFRQCCFPMPEFATPGTLHLHITDVSLAYAEVDTTRGTFAVPMYAFSEGGGTEPGLVSALAP